MVQHLYRPAAVGRFADPEELRQGLIRQLTSSVRWTQEVTRMIQDGATAFAECGPGKALQGMIAKIAKSEGREVEIGAVEA